jgi:cytochrome c oxidase subunit III
MSHIPYTVDRRADTGVTNVTMGIWLFLASEVMLFGALFSCYALLRTAAPDWPVGRNVLSLPLGTTNTIVLLVLTTRVWRARTASAQTARKLFAWSSILAMAFLVIKSVEWWHEISAGLRPSTSTFLATYFTLTGLHALHVIGGLVANFWAMTGLKRVGDAMTIGRFKALALYWVFVDIVWLVILVLMYLT